MGLRIPDKARELVRERDHGQCVRCGCPAEDWHHRRSRRRKDEHTHCPCNGILLCGKGNLDGCHGYVHARALVVRPEGLIIRAAVDFPSRVPFKMRGGLWMMPDCDGGGVTVEAFDMEEALTAFGLAR